MARVCEICGKGRQVGHKVSHAGNRAKKVWNPNLQTVRAVVDGKVRRIRVCTSCLKKGLVQKPMPKSV